MFSPRLLSICCRLCFLSVYFALFPPCFPSFSFFGVSFQDMVQVLLPVAFSVSVADVRHFALFSQHLLSINCPLRFRWGFVSTCASHLLPVAFPSLLLMCGLCFVLPTFAFNLLRVAFLSVHFALSPPSFRTSFLFHASALASRTWLRFFGRLRFRQCC